MHPHQALPELAVVGDKEVEELVNDYVIPEIDQDRVADCLFRKELSR